VLCFSTFTSETDAGQPSRDNNGLNKEELDDEFDDFLGGRPELQLQGVDPSRGWGFRGVHKVLCVVHWFLLLGFVGISSMEWNFDFVVAERKLNSINFESL
jgi:hypothetical protein